MEAVTFRLLGRDFDWGWHYIIAYCQNMEPARGLTQQLSLSDISYTQYRYPQCDLPLPLCPILAPESYLPFSAAIAVRGSVCRILAGNRNFMV